MCPPKITGYTVYRWTPFESAAFVCVGGGVWGCGRGRGEVRLCCVGGERDVDGHLLSLLPSCVCVCVCACVRACVHVCVFGGVKDQKGFVCGGGGYVWCACWAVYIFVCMCMCVCTSVCSHSCMCVSVCTGVCAQT